jgi:GntR family transcriptional regulator/MocR family aminotransferase
MNLPVQLERTSKMPLQDQLFAQLRQLIIDGKLKPNTRIIATRFLAELAGISRTTVLLAYERLISEGYLETRPAIGTFVSATLPEQRQAEALRVPLRDVPRQSQIRPARLRSEEHPEMARRPCSAGFDFSPARSDASNMLPAKAWLKAVRNVFESHPQGLAAPQPVPGVPKLRQAIADHLAATRGMMISADQVIIVAGRRQACSLVAHLFQRAGDRVVLESPGDAETASFFHLRGADIARVPVDELGLCTDALPEGDISLAYVTPARHNPLGGIMPLARREALIGWARHAGAYIVEDDSDSEFRYHGTSPQPLAAIDPYGLVFHSGSFAKTLGTGLGLGYLVAPPEFVEDAIGIKALTEADCPWLEQMVVADLLTSGEYHHHLRRVRKIYMERHDRLIEALNDHFGAIELMGVDAGTQLTWVLPDDYPHAGTVCRQALARGVILGSVPAQQSVPDRTNRYVERSLLLGFAGIAGDGLRDGVACLAQSLRA